MFKSHVASKLSVYEPETFFADGQGNQSKTETFYSLARNSETKRLGWVIKRSNDGFEFGTKRLFGEKWLRCSFDHVLVAQSRMRATKYDPLALGLKHPLPPFGTIF